MKESKMSNKYGRQILRAHTLHAKEIVLDGQCVTRESLLRAPEPAPAAQVVPEPARELLVRPESVSQEAFERERAARDEQCAELFAALQEAQKHVKQLADQRVTIVRKARKVNGRHLVAGQRVNATELRSSGGDKNELVMMRECSVAEALQQFAAELDRLHFGGKTEPPQE